MGKPSDIQWLASRITMLEKKKVSVSIGNVREVIHCLVQLEADLMAEELIDGDMVDVNKCPSAIIYDHALKIVKKKAKKKK